LKNQIDHFAVGAQSLEQGIAEMQSTLGVTLSPGSKHDLMSTHNCVMQAGNECFFELISIDPDAPQPSRTRWFTLDDANTQQRLSVRPRALCWVVNTDDLDAVVAASPVDLGEVVTFTRGDRSWRLTVPADGHLPGDALLPAFIEWSPGPHPSTAQADLGVRLSTIRLQHPEPEAFKRTLDALQVSHLAEVVEGEKALSFELDTPNGSVVLD
jgi:hypothetical protein